MKKYVDGILLEMTQEEIDEIDKSMLGITAAEPTLEERIAALEQELAAAKILLGLEE